ncbi:hypothetical protein GOP47_0025210 [Adiantum capillus-veneris]|uniref:Uncharacterized protein n=1 Tax=Adiantum capillus-veneris TaxID=13818 RepID=A0A9D4Z4D5_ADICA|nr:hypothetical protein GOP47_0025210 [Adiantum capillus-veneris]
MALKQNEVSFRSLDEVPDGSLTLEGHDVCFRNASDLLEAMGLPGGLLPMENVVDCGFDKKSGLVWIRQKKPTRHFFHRIRRTVSFGTEVRAYISPNRLHSVSGVHARELLLWAPVGDVSLIDEDKLKFKTYGGISKTFPADAFAKGE